MTRFDEELTSLKEMILKMGALVESSIKDSVRSLVERDDALARTIIERDHEINALDVQIDEECIRLIALMQPMAGDLRFLTTAMKITTDLERMGDNAVNIAERALELNREPILKPYIDIPHMSQIAQGMTRDALDAFVKKDKRLAMDVIMRDDEVDDLKYGILEELISYMIRDPNTVSRAMKISFVAQYLERIADHATNIAEMVIYLVAGKIIRHMALPKE
ncbi:phosphate transport system regulatory protein PhoU [Dissulfurispira thermophila]|uniref:Phosphate-specific transport system accessory protein PhoU n=2 Tax=root TaxID=1 RepID=A0A7G1GZ88_9BACT|nr:phosphate signaling complex protein PhoU [Dissulfurispira thermophila]BCB95319.1 phosphate transport system regulatory protein PhoU [Dissulfurispira thermophila]